MQATYCWTGPSKERKLLMRAPVDRVSWRDALKRTRWRLIANSRAQDMERTEIQSTESDGQTGLAGWSRERLEVLADESSAGARSRFCVSVHLAQLGGRMFGTVPVSLGTGLRRRQTLLCVTGRNIWMCAVWGPRPSRSLAGGRLMGRTDRLWCSHLRVRYFCGRSFVWAGSGMLLLLCGLAGLVVCCCLKKAPAQQMNRRECNDNKWVERGASRGGGKCTTQCD